MLFMHLERCQQLPLCNVADLESKLPEGHKLPTKMLALMKLLEAEGPAFAQKELITLTGACHLASACQCMRLRSLAMMMARQMLDSCACQTTLVARTSMACATLNLNTLVTRIKAGIRMGPGGQDKDLIYQAHTGTTVLDALRCAPLGVAPQHLHSTVDAVLSISAASLHGPLGVIQLGPVSCWLRHQASCAIHLRAFSACKCTTCSLQPCDE